MRLALLVAVVVAALSLALSAPGTVRACSIAAFDIENGARQADIIVFGRLVDADQLVATFEVEHSFGGDPLPPSLRVDNRFRTLGVDCSEPAEDRPRFPEGTYLAFLNHAADDQYEATWFGLGMVQVKGQALVPWWPHHVQEEPPFTLPQSMDEAQVWLAANVGEAVPPREQSSAEPGRSRAWLAVPVLLAAAITAGFVLRRVRRPGAR